MKKPEPPFWKNFDKRVAEVFLKDDFVVLVPHLLSRFPTFKRKTLHLNHKVLLKNAFSFAIQ